MKLKTSKDLISEVIKFISRKGAFDEGEEIFDLTSSDRDQLGRIGLPALEREIFKRTKLWVATQFAGCWLVGYRLILKVIK